MKGIAFEINRENLIELGIDPEKGIDYLENKLATTMHPVHVRALHSLKQKPAVATS